MQFYSVSYPCGEIFIPSFYRIPRPLFFHPELMDLSNNAKLLYTLLLDRMSLSVANSWFDDHGKIYIYFTLDEIQSSLNCSRPTAVQLINELDGAGLISRRRQGLGKPDRIYVHLIPDMELFPPKAG